MRPKYKVTGCARFVLFFIIFIPIVYFGAAYLRGEDGWQKLKDFYHNITGTENRDQGTRGEDNSTYHIEDLQKELDDAKAEIRSLQSIIKEKDKEIERLKSGGE
jgi:hypothetical protein